MASRFLAAGPKIKSGQFKGPQLRTPQGDNRRVHSATFQFIQSAIKILISWGCLALRLEAKTNRLPSGGNCGSRSWLEKAEFHCQRILELDPAHPEGHVAKAFLPWGPSKNFQHIEAIAELRRALALQKNLPHAYNRLGTILAHIGLLDHARTMYERSRPFDPRKTISHSIAQVYLSSGEYELARDELQRWRVENPASKYAIHFAPQVAILTGEREEARGLLDKAANLMQEEPLIISLQGVMHASLGESEQALRCMNRACTNPKSFGHARHTYYQIACILSLLHRPEVAVEWLERSVDTGFACWPFVLKDPCLKNLRRHARFKLLVSSLQAKYSDHLGLL